MKKIMIIIFALGVILNYSCKKENKEVLTSIVGQLRTNGTEDPIRMSNELTRPVVILYERIDQIGYTGSGYREFAKTTVDEKGRFNFKKELKKNELYFLGVENLDTSIYWQIPHDIWWGLALNRKFTRVTPGEENLKNLYISSKAWVNYHFINTINDPNTIFDIVAWGQYLVGNVDTIFNWNSKTWGGKYDIGYESDVISSRHHVTGKLTRNGVTRDTNIFYIVPPFDTTIVQIRY